MAGRVLRLLAMAVLAVATGQMAAQSGVVSSCMHWCQVAQYDECQDLTPSCTADGMVTPEEARQILLQRVQGPADSSQAPAMSPAAAPTASCNAGMAGEVGADALATLTQLGA